MDWAIFIGVVAAWVILFLSVSKFESGFHRIFHSRYSIGFGALLLFLPLTARLSFSRSLARALFVVMNPVEVGVLTWVCLMASLMVISTYWVTRVNLSARLSRRNDSNQMTISCESPDPESEDVVVLSCGWSKRKWAGFLSLGLWIPLATIFYTVGDLSATGQSANLTQLMLGTAAGLGAAVLTLVTLAFLQRILLDPSVSAVGLLPFERFAESTLGSRTDRFDITRLFVKYILPQEFRGYVVHYPNDQVSNDETRTFYHLAPDNPSEAQLAPGHAQLTLVSGVLLLIYVWWFYQTVHDRFQIQDNGVFPALAYGISILTIVLSFLAAANFYLLRYRLSSALIVCVVGFVTYACLDTNHYFDPWPEAANTGADTPQPIPLVANPSPTTNGEYQTVFDRWHFPEGPDGKRTLVVVNASGGGIQASAWTGQVLTGLDERFTGFGDSVGLISAVSGGSVGTMNYAALRPQRLNLPNQSTQLDNGTAATIRENCCASSLTATAWGMAFPDLVRVVAPPAVPLLIDRGSALEQAWNRRLGDSNDKLQLLDWAQPIREGKMPVVVFNATRVETGQRVTISPVYAENDLDYVPPPDEPIDFVTNYKRSNPYVVSAARLSATFSYVSPICKPLANNKHAPPKNDPLRYSYHIADGGYADNEGLVTSIRWIEQLVNGLVKREEQKSTSDGERTKLPFDRILIVRIMPFPQKEPSTAPKPNHGLYQSLLGPVSCLNSVRTATQAERGDLELRYLAQQMPVKNDDLDSIETSSAFNLDSSKTASKPIGTPSFSSDRLNDLLDRARGLDAAANRIRNKMAAPTKSPVKKITGKIDSLKKNEKFEYVPPDPDSLKLKQLESEARLLRLASIPLHHVTFQFCKSLDDYQPPLSWKLTPSQIKRVEEAWNATWVETFYSDGALASELAPGDLSRFFEEDRDPNG